MSGTRSRAIFRWVLFAAFLLAVAGAFLRPDGLAGADSGDARPKSSPANGFSATTTCACANAPKGQPGQDWRLADPVSYENMTVFPVVSGRGADTSGFATLDEALASGDAIVAEQGSYMRRTRDGEPRPVYSGAQVNQLVLVNRGKRPLLLLAGEVVSGGKQDRIIGKDRIVPVGAEPLPLDVFCVEHGRWTGGSDKFAAARTIVKPSVREKAAVDQDQGQVWAAVRGDDAIQRGSAGGIPGNASPAAAAPAISAQQLQSVIVTEAPSQSYKRIYESDRVAPRVETFAHEIDKRFHRATTGLKGERVVGVVVAYGGEVAWSDIFASSELFEAYWPKLLRSYVVEALTRPTTRENVSFDDARDFLRPASGHVREETEPGVYRWSERSEGREAEIEIEALQPKALTLHWLKVLRAS